MKWSWKLGQIAGIDILMHWTFLLVLAFVAGWSLLHGEGVIGALTAVGLVLAIFTCVVLHELGHAMMAKRYGIQTRDITLLPIGGVARLQRIPDNPVEELWVAIAGPAVNVVIALVLGCILWLMGGFSFLDPQVLTGGNFLVILLEVNVILVLFNILPAFPMDGGRMLRAILAMRMDYTEATNVAANVGQMMAILFGLAGLMIGNPFLIFIALFVYLGAAAEARMVQVTTLLEGVPVRDAMMDHFRTLLPDANLETATQELLAGSQQDFPIVEDGHFLGMLRRQDLVGGLQNEGPKQQVKDLMQTDCPAVEDREMLNRVMEIMREHECSTVPVLHEGRVIGLVTLENVGELMMVRSALRQGPSAKRPEDKFRNAA
jgi:Zn-dependent protease